MNIGMVTYQHECGKNFSVWTEDLSPLMAHLLPEEAPSSGESLEMIKGVFAKLAEAKESVFVDPTVTPGVVCDCGAWIDLEQVLKDHKQQKPPINRAAFVLVIQFSGDRLFPFPAFL